MDSERTLRDVSITHAVLCMVVIVLPLYYAVLTQSPRTPVAVRPSFDQLETPTGAMSAITGAAVSGEPACPVFPAGAGIGGGCRLIGSAGTAIPVPPECIGGVGCLLRVVASVSLSNFYAGADVLNGVVRRVSDVHYTQDPNTNIVDLGSSAVVASTTQQYITQPSYLTHSWYDHYIASETLSGVYSSAFFYAYSPINTLLQGGGSAMDSVRFKSGPNSPYSFTYAAGPSDAPCQLSIDSSLEADPTKFSVSAVPYALVAANSCELYVCS